MYIHTYTYIHIYIYIYICNRDRDQDRDRDRDRDRRTGNGTGTRTRIGTGTGTGTRTRAGTGTGTGTGLYIHKTLLYLPATWDNKHEIVTGITSHLIVLRWIGIMRMSARGIRVPPIHSFNKDVTLGCAICMFVRPAHVTQSIATDDRHRKCNMDRVLDRISLWRLPLVASQAGT